MHTYINRAHIVKLPPLDDLIIVVRTLSLCCIILCSIVLLEMSVYKIVHCWDLAVFTHNSRLEHKIMDLLAIGIILTR